MCLRGEEEKKNGTHVRAADTIRELTEWRKLHRNNLNMLGMPKGKEWPLHHRVSS